MTDMNREFVLDYINECLDSNKESCKADLRRLEYPEINACGTFDWDEIRKYNNDRLKEIEEIRSYIKENLK